MVIGGDDSEEMAHSIEILDDDDDPQPLVPEVDLLKDDLPS